MQYESIVPGKLTVIISIRSIPVAVLPVAALPVAVLLVAVPAPVLSLRAIPQVSLIVLISSDGAAFLLFMMPQSVSNYSQ